MKLTATATVPIRQTRTAVAQYQRDLRSAAIIATDRASREARRAVQDKIRSVGLGRLAGAVGQTSMRREGGAATASDPYGVIFARGGDESLGGGALESYSRGSTIEPIGNNQWLWIASKAIPRFVSVAGRRFRTTPALYKASGLMTTIGPLEFKPIGPNRALYVVKKVSLSAKGGNARAQTGRRTRTRINQKEIIAFVGIRITRRGKRFDKDREVAVWARRVPDFMREALADIQTRRGR